MVFIFTVLETFRKKVKKKKERNASDDYAGAAIGASIL